MRNLILIFSLFIFTGSTIKAQENVLFGAKGGINFANLSSGNFTETNTRTGFHLGLLAEIPLTSKFSIQPEILFSNQGTNADETTFEGTLITTDYKLDYLQVPVLAKLYLTESLAVEAGPSFNFLVMEEIWDMESNFGSDFEFGGALGVSYKIKKGFFGAVRYFQGFTNAINAFTTTYTNKGFQLGVGYMF